MKGIIVVDKIPGNCRYIKGDKENGCPFGGMVCQITKKDVMRHVSEGTKSEDCPIKPIPEKKEVRETTASIGGVFLQGRETGWNDCINEILKGDENGQEQIADR